jgi:hypothetical protein
MHAKRQRLPHFTHFRKGLRPISVRTARFDVTDCRRAWFIGIAALFFVNSRGVTLFLCGDVMTGRGVDQVLPHPSNPVLHEPYVQSALEYLAMAEEANGPIPKPVSFPYIWGDALEEID